MLWIDVECHGFPLCCRRWGPCLGWVQPCAAAAQGLSELPRGLAGRTVSQLPLEMSALVVPHLSVSFPVSQSRCCAKSTGSSFLNEFLESILLP